MGFVVVAVQIKLCSVGGVKVDNEEIHLILKYIKHLVPSQSKRGKKVITMKKRITKKVNKKKIKFPKKIVESKKNKKQLKDICELSPSSNRWRNMVIMLMLCHLSPLLLLFIFYRSGIIKLCRNENTTNKKHYKAFIEFFLIGFSFVWTIGCILFCYKLSMQYMVVVVVVIYTKFDELLMVGWKIL